MYNFFISSTFKDMVGERELLQKSILPTIREIKGKDILFSDLRWGIDTGRVSEEDSLRKIMDVCLEEIERCEGYIIAFLGDEYGTVSAETNNMRQVWKKYTDDELESYDISLTQLELEYALYRQKKRQKEDHKGAKILCFIRTLTNKTIEKSKKQMDLVSKLQYMNEEIIWIPYEAEWDSLNKRAINLDFLEDILLKNLKEIIGVEQKEEKNLKWTEQELMCASMLCAQQAFSFGGREELLSNVNTAIENENYNTIYIWGTSGSGKSSLMATTYERINKSRDEDSSSGLGTNAYFVVCGAGERSRSYLDVLLQMVYFVEQELRLQGINADAVNPRNIYSEENAESAFMEAVGTYNEKGQKKLVIFVDALDKLTSFGNINLATLLSNKKKSKVKIVCSSIFTFKPMAETIFDLEVSTLKLEDIRDIVKKNMYAMDELAKSNLVDAISSKKESASPLYVITVLNIIKMSLQDINSMNNSMIYDFYKEKIDSFPNDLPRLCSYNIEVAGEYLEFPLYREVVGLMANSKGGLREEDFGSLLSDKGWLYVDFTRFRRYLETFFRCQVHGNWNFAHDLIKEGVHITWESDMSEWKKRLYEHTKTLTPNDAIRIEEGLRLSALYEDVEFAEEILHDATLVDEKIHTIIMKILYEIVQEEERMEWYRKLIDKYSYTVMEILEKGLHFNAAVDYERRYPAYQLTIIYWEHLSHVYNRIGIEDLFHSYSNWEEKFLFASFCTEFVGINDDISKNVEAFSYELPGYSFITRYVSFKNIADEYKAKIFGMANIILFCNNKLLKNKEIREAFDVSKNIIKWYDSEIVEPNYQFDGRMNLEGKFLSNIGQYYNALEKYKEAYPYRIKALKLKTEDLLLSMNLDPNDYQDLFYEFSKENISLIEHQRYWKEIEEQYTIFLKKNNEELGQKLWSKWFAIGISYRTISNDYFYQAKEGENKEELLIIGKQTAELCLNFLNHTSIQKAEKEKVVTYVRLLGIKLKLYQSCRLVNLEEIVSDISKIYEQARTHCKRDGQELLNLQEHIETVLNDFAITQDTRKELQRIDDMIHEIRKTIR